MRVETRSKLQITCSLNYSQVGNQFLKASAVHTQKLNLQMPKLNVFCTQAEV